MFLLPAFTGQGHECQDILSLCDGMHVYTDHTLVYTVIRKSFREWSQNHINSKGKNPSVPSCVLPVNQKLGLSWKLCLMPRSVGSVLGLVDMVSVYCDGVR